MNGGGKTLDGTLPALAQQIDIGVVIAGISIGGMVHGIADHIPLHSRHIFPRGSNADAQGFSPWLQLILSALHRDVVKIVILLPAEKGQIAIDPLALRWEPHIDGLGDHIPPGTVHPNLHLVLFDGIVHILGPDGYRD